MSVSTIWCSTNKGVVELALSGGRWGVKRLHFQGAKSPIVLPLVNGKVYAALKHGHFGSKLHRSDDGGATWKELAPPAYPTLPEGTPPELHAMTQKPIPWNLEMIWSLEPGGREGELWCGTLPGGLFKSTDHGESWKLCESLWRDPRRLGWFGGGYDYPGVHSVCVDPKDADHVVIGISCGGIWETHDGGESWTLEGKGMIAEYMPPGQQEDQNTQDPHRLVACPGDFNKMWVQHHCGIFGSTDGGKTFTKLGPKMGADPSGFGFAVAVHPKDGKTAWFVPSISDEVRMPVAGRVEVLRTTDGGATFEQLQKGLPQTDAYDLVYRHSLDISADGKTLVFGSTSGSLWMSGNGGDSWETLSNYLPPIYAVKII